MAVEFVCKVNIHIARGLLWLAAYELEMTGRIEGMIRSSFCDTLWWASEVVCSLVSARKAKGCTTEK